MLQLTKRTEYGLLALVHLVDRPGEFVSVREIAEHYPIPKRLLAEVLKDLSHVDLVSSQRGAAGGYALVRAPEAVTVGDVVAALEGAPSLTSCESLALSGLSGCEVEPRCPIRSPIHHLREGIWDLLQRTTLRDLSSPPPSPRKGTNADPLESRSAS